MKIARYLILVLSVYFSTVSAQPTFPTVFTATYNQSDGAQPWDPQGSPQFQTISLDVPNKRARIDFTNYLYKNETNFLIFSPSGAEPGTPASVNYTLFDIHPTYPSKAPDDCLYSAISDMTLSEFPRHWISDNKYRMQVKPWMIFPDNMRYVGVYFISELGVWSDRWDSETQCNLILSRIGVVPCVSFMVSRDASKTPLMDIRAHGAPPHSFDSDHYLVRVYHRFENTVQDSAFTLPQSWVERCGNADNGFNIWPHFATTVYTTGFDQKIIVSLTTPPIRALGGNTTVRFVPKPNNFYNCTDCVDLAGTLNFDLDDWDTPKVIQVELTKLGCSRFLVVGVGGGYEFQYSQYHYIIYTCEGSTVSGCKYPVCGI